MNLTTLKRMKTNRILMAASLLLALVPLAQAGQITWALQDVTIATYSGSTVTGGFVWDTALNSGAGGVASARILVNYLGRTLDVDTAGGATLNYFGVNSTSGVINNWQIAATNAQFVASGVFNGINRIQFKEQNPTLGFSDTTATQFGFGFISFRGNGCCDYANSGSFVNQTLADAPEPASIALAGPVLGLWLLLRRRRTV